MKICLLKVYKVVSQIVVIVGQACYFNVISARRQQPLFIMLWGGQVHQQGQV